MGHQGQAIYWCGGAWGQTQGLTAQQVAQIVQASPGPHYVWAPGMAEWAPAESVPAIAAAVRALGGATVADVPSGAQDTSPPPVRGPAGPTSRPEETERGGIDGNRIVFLGLVGLLVILLLSVGIALVVGRGGKRQAQPPPTPAPTPAATPVPTPPPPPPLPRVTALAERPESWARAPLKDGRRQFGRAEASSELLERNGTLHGALRAADTESSTAWCESAEGDGMGEWLELRLDCSAETAPGIAGLAVRAGYGSRPESWRQNNRVARAELTIRVSGWESWRGEVKFEDVPAQQFVPLPVPIPCQPDQEVAARVRILDVFEGSSYTDTCISSIAFCVSAP